MDATALPAEICRVKLHSFPLQTLLSRVFPISVQGTHHPPHYSNWNQDTIPVAPLICFIPTRNLSARAVNPASKIYSYPTNLSICLSLQGQATCISSLSYCKHHHLGFPESPTPLIIHKSIPEWPFNKWTSSNVTSFIKTTQWLPMHIK